MEVFFVALVAVSLAELGDKTQFVALTLSARCQQPWPVLAGILLASLANHGLAAVGGVWVSRLLPDEVVIWLVGLGFLAMAFWALRNSAEEEAPPVSLKGAFITTFVLFFLMEMGDKTQIATAALAAHYSTFFWVVAGSVSGMMVVNAPTVWFGHCYGCRISPRLLHLLSALIFGAIGLWVLAPLVFGQDFLQHVADVFPVYPKDNR
ncbi:MAG: TMEM165/GDT1 family protein [Desulfurivibrio sp.]|nr:TMEM165/GDT1 family protein [Desulfurivibrio sp.]